MAPWAQYRFAKLLHQDVQGYEDFQLGVALLRASAEAGYGKAAYHFGKLLMESTPVENDMFDARRYLSTAVSQDIEGAQAALDRWPALYAERFCPGLTVIGTWGCRPSGDAVAFWMRSMSQIGRKRCRKGAIWRNAADVSFQWQIARLNTTA